MWILYGLLPSLLVLALIAGAVALVVRGRSDGWSIEFPTVMLACAALAMLAGVVLAASGGALLLKAGFAEASDRDFSYHAVPYENYYPYPGEPDPVGRPVMIDPSDAAIRDDVATGVSLAFAGTAVFAIGGFTYMLLRRGHPAGEQLIVRSYNLIGLAVASIAFLAAGAAALNDLMRRYVLEGATVDPWAIRHPGEPLAIALVMLPVALWFGFRVWQELGDADTSAAQLAPGAGSPAVAL